MWIVCLDNWRGTVEVLMAFTISAILSLIVNSERKPAVFLHGFISFLVTSGCDIQRSSIKQTSLLVPGDPGRLGTLIYVVTVETSRPGQARHTRLGYGTWKSPRNLPGIEPRTSRLVTQCHIYIYIYTGSFKKIWTSSTLATEVTGPDTLWFFPMGIR